jgi:L,D-transpeptidase ErfK/SrfK
MKYLAYLTVLISLGLVYCLPASSEIIDSYVSPASNSQADAQAKTVIGKQNFTVIKGKDTLLDVARRFNLGYIELVEANPKIDPWIPQDGAVVLLPTEWIPPTPRLNTIVINKAELRLFYFYKQDGQIMVKTYPLGIGRDGFSTPNGTFKASSIVKNPTWIPTADTRRDKPWLPAAVPPGPDNPLGTHRIKLSNTVYGIHGTNLPYGVGRYVSRGCIRMYPEDIIKLVQAVKVGTPIVIIDEPVKIGYRNGNIYVEYEGELSKFTTEQKLNLYNRAVELLDQKGLTQYVDLDKVRRAVHASKGLPILISDSKRSEYTNNTSEETTDPSSL